MHLLGFLSILIYVGHLVTGHYDHTTAAAAAAWPPSPSSASAGRLPNAGAARQIYGSSAQRPNDQHQQRSAHAKTSAAQLTKTHHDPPPPPPDHLPADVDDMDSGNASDEHYDETPRRTYPHGVIVTQTQDLPHHATGGYDASNRGGFRVSNAASSGDLYGIRPYGERHGNDRLEGRIFWPHGVSSHHVGVAVLEAGGRHSVVAPEDDLLGALDAGGGQSDGPHVASSASAVAPRNAAASDSADCRLECLGGVEFLCRRTCACISMHLRCDGEAQCADREDEEECTLSNEAIVHGMMAECETGERHTMCPRTFVCIAKDWLCDGDDDCGDFSDETRCVGQKQCAGDQFECANGLCVPMEWACDGDNDCKDYSDEVNCTRAACGTAEFRCPDGNCVSAAFRCDGDADCADGTDELNCLLPMSNCPEGEFKCKASVRGTSGHGGKCILLRFRCDGDNDCGDWSDEEGCPATMASCAATEFKCGDGICIPGQWRCDNEQDCDSGEDEDGCTAGPTSRAGGALSAAASATVTATNSCAGEQFACKDGRCIMRTWLCDGVADCRRAEDEMNCPSVCDVGQFTCPRYQNMSAAAICVHQKHICDGRKDCLNGEDELQCPQPINCTAHTRCQQLCVQSAGVDDSSPEETCACRLGYTLHANGHNCTDIDECAHTHDPVCSQSCRNTAGSFRCSCVSGYVLRPDLRTCKALGGAVRLIMANRADIREMSLSSNHYNALVKGLHNVIALDYSLRAQLVFWSDVSTDVIRVAHLNGTGIRTVVQWGLEAPGGIAVDWIHELVFWTDSGTRRVEVATFDGRLRSVVAANDLDKPRAVAVHPGEAMIFWTDWGNGMALQSPATPKIERAYMDGSERQVIVSAGVFWPNGLAVDYATDRLYWADAKHHVIESCGFSGAERRKILSTGLPHPFALTIFEDLMIWTDWHTKKISAANKVTGKGFRNVHEGLNFPMDVHSLHPSRQPDYRNRCEVDKRGLRGGCSHICLPNKWGRRCACPIGLTLKDDDRTCSSVPNNLLIIARKKDIRLRQLYIHGQRPDDTTVADLVIPLDGLKSTIALDWCADTDRIFWTDVGRAAISRANLNGTAQLAIVTSNLIAPAGLAVDWVTHKVYWTDSGTHRIEVADMDGRQRALLVWRRLEKLRDIVLHPGDGLMFWSDWGTKPQIEVAAMDGSQRRALVTENLKFPNGLAVDWQRGRLYFVDGGTKTLEYVQMADGSGRTRVITHNMHHPFGVDVFGQRVYWTDWDTQTVDEANKDSGTARRSLVNGTSDLMDVRVFHRERPKVRNPCEHDNGGCSHMCLLRAGGFACVCPVGVRAKSLRVCHDGPFRYIVLAHRIDVRVISLDIDYSVDVILPLPAVTNAVALDVDRQTGEIYWSDTVEDTIGRATPDGKRVRTVVRDTLDNVDGLAVDSVGRKVYWTDGGRHTIEVAELDGTSRAMLVWQDLDNPRGLALDYAAGFMFWTDWGVQPKIERAQMDGTQRLRLVSAGLVWPNGLSVDVQERRVYWVDAQVRQVESCDYEGNGRRVETQGLAYPYGVAVTPGEVYWTDWNTTALHAVEKRSKDSTRPATGGRTVLTGLQGLMDVKVVDKNDILPANACGTNNGGCSHLCLRNSLGFACRCPTGIRMQPDNPRKCHQMPDEYLLVALRSGIGRISLDTPDLLDVVLPIAEVHGSVVVDYHYNLSKLFYADVHIDAIKVVDMTNMTDVRTIVASGLQTPNGLAVDWLANNLYWSDSVARVIEVARLDGSSRKKIISTDLTDPRSLIVYPKRGLIFWSDWGKQARIERSHMDGTGRKSVVSTDNGFPTGMAIDFETRKLYWTDALQDRIETCNLDGRQRSTFIKHTTHPYGLALAGGFVYWTDWYNKSVFRAPQSGAKLGTEIRHGLRGALDMRSVSRRRQPGDSHPCVRDNGGCSHLCLFRGQSYVCACPDRPDGRVCKSEPPRSVTSDDEDGTFDYGIGDRSGESLDTDDDTNDDDASAADSKKWIIAIAVTSTLLVIVVIVIIVLCCSWKRQRDKRSPMGSTRSVLTFTNPNYNGADGAAGGAGTPGCGPGPSTSGGKQTIWKRLKYDKAQDRVYEETKCMDSDSMNATRNLIAPPTPSPMPSPCAQPAAATVATIG